ncbi:MAG: glycosyl hydrolase family 39, partial [Bryocella sp.]
SIGALAQDTPRHGEVRVNWKKTIAESKSTPTLQVVVNPQLERGAALHDPSFAALKALGADYVRYVPWLPYPKQAVAELNPPKDGKTSWDFTYIDPTLEDFMKAQEGHTVMLNFSTMPAWMWKTAKPVPYPADPQQVVWNYTQGTELVDPTMKQAADYYTRLLSWYEKGGFTDESGNWHASGHHYKIAYWELLNEIDIEHHWTPEMYTKFFDIVSAAMRKVDPNLKFVALALAHTQGQERMFEYFLNPANHAPGTPLDFISYHFYAAPSADQTLHEWQYTFFDQADGFIKSVGLIEEIRKRYSPTTKTDLNEIGVILPVDGRDNRDPTYKAPEPPKEYWNLAGAMYAYLYEELAKVGVDVIGESQLVGYHTQFPSVTMMDYITNKPNARFWVLKLLKDNFGPGDRLVPTSARDTEAKGGDEALSVQAFDTSSGKQLLLINRRQRRQVLTLPAEFVGGTVTYVAPSTGDNAPASSKLAARTLDFEPFEVAVVTAK